MTPTIDITFGMHEGHVFTYQVYMTDGKRSIAKIFDCFSFRAQVQYFIKNALKAFKRTIPTATERYCNYMLEKLEPPKLIQE